ncbi:MAG: helix-turn-helix domain-containing protein [Candidatus Aenigmarchaeota archaeon]|nr:helix-turn-helix domain-containing protein [Candidatus Aenigmarchaeota archaeon]
MKTVFEVVSQEVLPCVRALVAKKLIENGFSQKQVADKLKVSQPAISQYKRDLRGHRTGIFVNYPRLLEDVDAVAKRVASGELSMEQATTQLFETCRTLIE